MARSSTLRLLLIALLGCAVVFFFWRFFELDANVARMFLPPPEVH